MGAAIPKQYIKLHGKEVLAWTLEVLSGLDFLEKTVLVLHPDDKYFSEKMAADFPTVLQVEGGEERQHSVSNGLNFLKSLAADDDWVLVHDAARPCVKSDDIYKLLNELEDDPVGGILASRVKDTLKQADDSLQVISTLDRNDYWLAATPQLFRIGLLVDALNNVKETGQIATDEAAAIEAMGLPVKLVEGHSDNIKITSSEDLALAEFLLEQAGKVDA
jgi:2-C-methyl-D-erythritol 4-phosphate cytidylyltransferase